MTKLNEYLKVSERYLIPETMQAVILSDVGEKNFKLTTTEVPRCNNDQLLARVDAAVACASDNKLIDQGPEHPLMYGWDVSEYPIIIGHEGAITLVKVGENLKGKYHVGQKFAVQPAVPTSPFHFKERYRNNAKGINKIAIGYTLPGLFAEYVLIPEEVIETGCLLPFSDNISFFGASLAEPLSDVVAAQEQMVHILKDSLTSPRRAIIGPKKGGVTLIIGTGPMGLMHIEVAMSYRPRKIIVSEVLDKRREKAFELFKEKANQLGIGLFLTSSDQLREVIDRETGGLGVDDVIVALGIAKVQEESLNFLAQGGVSCFFGGTSFQERMIQVDTHRIHYNRVTAVGSSGSDPSDVSRALHMIAQGFIDPGNFVVKVGGIDASVSLINAVRHKEIDGKGVIYPHTRSTLFDVKGWNLEKERRFLEQKLLTNQ